MSSDLDLDSAPRPDGRGWPGYLPGGWVRTSTAALIIAFAGIWWLYETYQRAPEPEQVPAINVVPPGFIPDPSYTWVPRTAVQSRVPVRPTPTTTSTPTTTELTPTPTTPTAPGEPTPVAPGEPPTPGVSPGPGDPPAPATSPPPDPPPAGTPTPTPGPGPISAPAPPTRPPG